MVLKRKKSDFLITYVNYGIASRYPNKEIDINYKLKNPKYRKLLREIIEHEKKHTDKGYSNYDFALDMEGFKNKGLYWHFILNHPSAWLQMLPMVIRKGRMFFDINVFILWICSILIIWLITMMF